MILSRTTIIKEIVSKSKAKGFANFKVGDIMTIECELSSGCGSYAGKVKVNGIKTYMSSAYSAVRGYVLEEVK